MLVVIEAFAAAAGGNIAQTASNINMTCEHAGTSYHFNFNDTNKTIAEVLGPSAPFVSSCTIHAASQIDVSPAAAHPYESFWVLLVALLAGNVMFHIISRKLHGLPYTCAMLFCGALLAFVHDKSRACWGQTHKDYKSCESNSWLAGPLARSIDAWYDIDAHLILFGFLPLLVFRDAMTINTHEFSTCFAQCSLLAGPGVVMGTTLTYLVAKHVLSFPKLDTHWGNLICLCFGSIASATDPVAVVSLLKDVGASSVLTIQVTGESLLNDGVAMVLFVLFFDGIKDPTLVYNAGYCIKLFVQFAVGGPVVGYIAGRLAMKWITMASNRTMHTDAVLQIMITLTFAYFSFFFAEGSLHVSGVLAAVTAALVLAEEGRPIFVSNEAMDAFWHLVEHTANTVLFFLAGLLIGHVMCEQLQAETFWQILLFWVLANIIRGIVLLVLYPMLSRIGYGTSPAAATFMVWGGLRGAVGLALAIYAKQACKGGACPRCAPTYPIDHPQYCNAEDSAASGKMIESHTEYMVIMVGGFAFATLFINGVLAGPVLKKLGLLRTPHSREVLFARAKTSISIKTAKRLNKLREEGMYLLNHPVLGKEVAQGCTQIVGSLYGFCPGSEDFSWAEKASGWNDLIERLAFKNILKGKSFAKMRQSTQKKIQLSASTSKEKLRQKVKELGRRVSHENAGGPELAEMLVAQRGVFLRIVKNQYFESEDAGALDEKMCLVLTHCADVASDHDVLSEPLSDWRTLQEHWPLKPGFVETLLAKFVAFFKSVEESKKPPRWMQLVERFLCLLGPKEFEHGVELGLHRMRSKRRFAKFETLESFINAHEHAQACIEYYSARGTEAAEVSQVKAESEGVVAEARKELEKVHGGTNVGEAGRFVGTVTARLAEILLEGERQNIESMVMGGMVTIQEGHEMLHNVDKSLRNARHWVRDGFYQKNRFVNEVVASLGEHTMFAKHKTHAVIKAHASGNTRASKYWNSAMARSSLNKIVPESGADQAASEDQEETKNDDEKSPDSHSHASLGIVEEA